MQLAAAASDADNAAECGAHQSLTYGWFFVALPTGSHAAFNDPEIESPSFVPDLAGDYVVRAKVTDDTGRSTVSAPVTVEVSPCGGATPVVSAIQASPAAPNAGQTVQLTATVEDADSLEPCGLPQSFTYEWTLAAQPAGSEARLNNRVAANPSLLADMPGEYAVELAVTDSTGLRSYPGRFTFQVSTCGAAVPVALVDAPASAAIGSLVQAEAVVSDADTEPPCAATETFTYAWAFESLPVGSTATLNALDVRAPSFVPDVAGDYALRLVATDAAGHLSLPAVATVSVSSCGGNAPVATASASTTAPALNEPVLLTASATD
ncbi:MAG TPA: hypothetical protein DFS52_10835, partial [Myxococcales bacterium]|nr:hypothetical protein [Myxococcales bacterium]